MSMKINESEQVLKKTTNLHYTLGITPKRVTSGGDHFRGLARGQHKLVAAVVSRWRHCVLFD